MEAIVLVGGQGTRLRPLTLTTPKPMLPAAGVPLLTHLLARAREAGITRAVLSTSYRAEVFESHFGTGAGLALDLAYVTEPSPLGTGGGIRHVVAQLTSGPDDPVVVFNGDVLSGVDIAALVRAHRRTAAAVTLHLVRAPDPRAFGLVPTDDTGAVTAFLEKPSRPEDIVTDQINAGCYVFTRRVIDTIPMGRPVSVERETFPGLLAAGARLTGVVQDVYWRDLGTPEAFLAGCRDLVTGVAPSPALPGPPGERLVLPGALVAPGAVVIAGATVGARACVGEGATIDGSVLFDEAVVEPGAVVRESIVGRGAVIGAGAQLDGVVVGDGARVAAATRLCRGERIAPPDW